MAKVRQSPLVGGRQQLADFCNYYGLIRAAEIGTDQGVFAKQFLDRWRGAMLYCIDSYEPYPTSGAEAVTLVDRTPDLLMATTLLAPYAHKCRIIKADSSAVAEGFKSAHLQFIYIDACHDYASVTKDLNDWWPVLTRGGVLAGHDYNLPDVEKAVKEFVDKNGVRMVELTHDYDQPVSWFFWKKKK